MNERAEHDLDTTPGGMRSGGVAARVRELIESPLAKMGYRVVQVQYGDGGRRASVQVMAERADLSPMSFDDCEQISRMTASLLDVADPISKAYNLEVLSPGPERPLVTLQDFERFTGHSAKLELVLPRDGQRKFAGTIAAVRGDEIELVVDGRPCTFNLREVRGARLAEPKPHIQSKATRKKHSPQ